jgi:NAD-dependent deacetylase
MSSERNPRKIIVFSGAGISADSGIPTFRGGDGLWMNHKVGEVADITTWRDNRDLVHRFFNTRRIEAGTVAPNPAHHMIKRLQDKYGAVIITQNIDDLFEQAHCVDVVHVHGRLNDMTCVACGTVFEIGMRVWDHEAERCPKCDSKKGVKPGPIFFHEAAPLYTTMYREIASLKKGDVFLVMGTSGQVVDAGAFARTTKATTILSNLETQPAPEHYYMTAVADSDFDHVLHGRASERAGDIEALVDQLMGESVK